MGLPGRIFIEVATHDDAKYVCNGIVGVKTSTISIVPEETAEIYRTVYSHIQHPRADTWVRITMGQYQGDLGYVLKVMDDDVHEGEHVKMLLLPRISYLSDNKRRMHNRPDAAPLDVKQCVAAFGREILKVKKLPNGKVERYHFKSQEFDSSGFMVLNTFPNNAFNPTPVLPPLELLKKFLPCVSISESAMDCHFVKVAQASVKLGDQVKFVDGDFQDAIGVICELLPVSYAKVQLAITEQVVQVPLGSVRRYFCIGDQVCIKSGAENVGARGYVISIDNEAYAVAIYVRHPKEDTFAISINHIKFDIDDHTFICPRGKQNELSDMHIAHHNEFLGNRVLFKNKPHKGLEGVIRAVNTKGVAQIKVQGLFAHYAVQLVDQLLTGLFFHLKGDPHLYEVIDLNKLKLIPTKHVIADVNLFLYPRTSSPKPIQQTGQVTTSAAAATDLWKPNEQDQESSPTQTVAPRISDTHWITELSRCISENAKNKKTKQRFILLLRVQASRHYNAGPWTDKVGQLVEINGNQVRLKFLKPEEEDGSKSSEGSNEKEKEGQSERNTIVITSPSDNQEMQLHTPGMRELILEDYKDIILQEVRNQDESQSSNHQFLSKWNAAITHFIDTLSPEELLKYQAKAAQLQAQSKVPLTKEEVLRLIFQSKPATLSGNSLDGNKNNMVMAFSSF
ncbi:Transcription elongation factor SPT5 [Leucoagaricus sp. SymC.cos]|nr:Transcription elongation factor SPT5 [Leucoagaricus sp. SymC.cos]